MNWPAIKELLIKDGAVIAMGLLYSIIKVIDRFGKQETADIRMFKVKTKNHHVRLIVDNSYDSPCIIAKRRGFFKDWSMIEKKDLPQCLVEDIFEPSCSPEKRKRLVSRMLDLKAFW